MNIEALVLGDAHATPRERRIGVGKLGSTGTVTASGKEIWRGTRKTHADV